MNIMRACCAGMSTSILVNAMEKAAADQGKDYKIWADNTTAVADQLGNFDVLLLGPQVRHMQRKMTKLVDGKAPVAVIDAVAYGRADGAAVLKQAEDLVNA